MNFVLSAFLLFLGFIIGIFLYSNMVVPLLWLPYVLLKVIKNELKFGAIFLCILPPIIWIVILLFIGFIDTLLFKSFITRVVTTGSFAMGSIFALIITILNAYSQTASTEFKENLNNYIKF